MLRAWPFHTHSRASAAGTVRDGILGRTGSRPASLASPAGVFALPQPFHPLFRPPSWCLQRDPIRTRGRSVPITRQSCRRPWSAREASETPGPPLSSELPGPLSQFLRDPWCLCCKAGWEEQGLGRCSPNWQGSQPAQGGWRGWEQLPGGAA